MTKAETAARKQALRDINKSRERYKLPPIKRIPAEWWARFARHYLGDAR